MTRPRPQITARAVTRSPGRAPVPGPFPPGQCSPTDGRGSDAAPAFSGSDLDPARGTMIGAAVGAALWAAALAALAALGVL